MEVVRDWEPAEALLLVQGLPERSRFRGKLLGDVEVGWSSTDWILFDIRNVVEALRAGKQKDPSKAFREWHVWPGREAERRRVRQERFDKAFSLLGENGRSVVD